MSKKQKVKVFLPFIFSLVLILGMYIGNKMTEASGNKKIITQKNNQSKIDQFLEYVKLRYVDSVNVSQLENSAISGVLEELDPHSTYIPPKRLKRSNQSLKGRFEGIGIKFFIVNDTITVVTPISGGPSAKLGIQANDKIVKINGENVAGTGITNGEVIDKLRGRKGTEVEVSIKRAGEEGLLDFTIVRDKIPLHSVDASFMLNDTIGYIKISRFSATTYREFMKGLNELKNQGATNLLLDLTTNPGGYMQAATKIADEFLPNDQLIVYTNGRTQPRREVTATKQGSFETGDIAVMIDERSASASEILAGAIQDWGRGKIVGRRSFGKGLVQEQHIFDDSSAIRLTIARYYTPAGRSIQKPYEKENFKKYYREIIERYKQGELQHSDSIEMVDSLKYEAPSGKTVYGGGGIMPDIFVPIDTANRNSDFLRNLRRKNIIPEFSYNYVGNHQKLKDQFEDAHQFKESFTIDDDIFQSFLDYSTKQGVQPNNALSTRNKEFIKTSLKAFMAEQMWGSEAQYLINLENNDIFHKGLEVLEQQ